MVTGRFRGRTVGVLMGGLSSEKEISLMTGHAVCQALQHRGYEVTAIHVGPNTAWVHALEKVDVAFIALHGKWGEDGSVQGLLELFKIPYTGSGILASALGMNKVMAKEIWQSRGLPTPRWQVVTRTASLDVLCQFPAVVKPNNEGSSVGVTIARSREMLAEAVDKAGQYDPEILLEEYIPGKEITVGILGQRTLAAMEVIPKGEFHTYEVKYTPGREEFILPAPLSSATYARTLELAFLAHQALGCQGYNRVDLRVRDDKDIFLIEVNTLPGLTPLSWLPKIAAYAGLSYEDLVEEILDGAGLRIGGEP